jgi:nucleoside-diphosphate-sugar epimerase
MTGIVQPAVADTSSLQKSLPLVIVRVRVQRLADGRSEHPSLFAPKLTSPSALAVLFLAVKGLLAQLRAPRVTAIETGPLDAWRDYVDVRDIAAAVVTAASARDLPPLINLGSGKAVQTREAVASLVAISGTGAAIHETAPTNATKSGPSGGTSWQLGDITRATQVLGWQPQVSLSESLGATWSARDSAMR